MGYKNCSCSAYVYGRNKCICKKNKCNKNCCGYKKKCCVVLYYLN